MTQQSAQARQIMHDSTGYKSRKQDYERKNIGDEIRYGKNYLWIFWF